MVAVVAGERGADLFEHPLEVGGLEAAVAAAGRADADERDVRCRERPRRCRSSHVIRPAASPLPQQLVEIRLGDRRMPAANQIELGGVDVDARDVVPGRRQAGGRHRADVPQAENRDSHPAPVMTRAWRATHSVSTTTADRCPSRPA